MNLGRSLLVLSSVLALAGAAHARPTAYTSNVNGTGIWNDSNNWLPNTGFPGTGDTATIVDDDIITVGNSQVAANVTIDAGGELQVNASGVLTVSSAVAVSGQLMINSNGQVSADDVTVESGGLLQLDGSGASIAELLFPSSAASPSLLVKQPDGVVLTDSARIRVAKTMAFTQQNSGSIKGQHNAVTISLDTDNTTAVTLDVILLAHGGMTFEKYDAGSAAANLVNSGEFRADVNGLTITLAASLNSLDDSDTAALRWYVSASGATMIFNMSTSSLAGHFQLASNGLFRFNDNADVATSGTFSIACGSNLIEVRVGTDASFNYGSIGTESCVDPVPDPIEESYNCVCNP